MKKRRWLRRHVQLEMGSGELCAEADCMKILLVDGSAPVRQSIKKLLADLHEAQIVGEAETELAALALLEKLRPEVVIMDLVLKSGSGFEVLKTAKNCAEAPIVIALTNYVSPPFRRKAQEAGVDFFLDKSTEFEKVVKVLRERREEGKAGNAIASSSGETTVSRSIF